MSGAASHDSRVVPVLALFAVLAGLLSIVPIFDSDVFWHLRTGQEILSEGRIERHDVYSHTARGRPFNNHEWLADVVMAWVHGLGGFDGLILAHAGLVSLLMVVLAWAAWERGARGLAIPIALLYALLLTNYRFLLKPELVTFLGVAILDALANRYLRSGRRVCLWLMPLLVAAWVNVHIGVVMAVAVVAAHAVGEELARRGGWAASGGRGRPQGLGITLGFIVLATLVNPYGLDVFEPVLKIYSSTAVKSAAVREWAPPSFAAFRLFYVLAPIATLAVACWPRRLRTQDAALWIAGLGLALVSLRHVALFGVMSAPILARHLHLLSAPLGARAGSVLPNLARRFRPWVRAAVLSAAGVALASRIHGPHASLVQLDEARHFLPGLGIDTRVTPVESVELIERHRLGGPLYNSYHLGGYVIWRSWPRLEVFLDGRHYVYEGLLAELDALDGDASAVMARYGIRLALVAHSDLAYARALRASPSFHLVAFDDAASVYVREDELARHGGLAVLDRLAPHDTSLAWLEPGGEALALLEARRATMDSPRSARAWFLLAAITDRMGDVEQSLRSYERAVALDPLQMSYRNNLGRAQLARGDVAAAERSFAEARALDPAAVEPVYNHALALARLGRVAAARRLLHRAVRMPDCPAAAWQSLRQLERAR